MQTKKNAHKVARILSNILLITFLWLCFLIGITYYRTYQVKQIGKDLSEIRTLAQREECEQDVGDWSKGMLAVNPDYAGWLTVYGTKVDGPVVYSGDNEWYMRRNINGQNALSGTLFLDGDTDFDLDGNLIVYGHKMKDGTMFGSLDFFKDSEFFKDNGIVRWEDEAGAHYYKVFALMVVPGSSLNTGYVDIRQWNNDPGFSITTEMLNTIRSKASVYQETRFSPDDRFIFLVTCDYTEENGRLVLVGKRM